MGLDGVEEADELLVPVALHAAADDGAVDLAAKFDQRGRNGRVRADRLSDVPGTDARTRRILRDVAKVLRQVRRGEGPRPGERRGGAVRDRPRPRASAVPFDRGRGGRFSRRRDLGPIEGQARNPKLP